MAASPQFSKRYAPAEATRGCWVPIDTSTISNYPTGDSTGPARGRYAQITYLVGSEPGALSLSLSGSTVILPVSTVSLTEPVAIENQPGQDFVVTQNHVDTPQYDSLSIPATSVANVAFATTPTLIEFFNNDTSNTVYIGWTNVSLSTLSAQALPLLPEAFYSIEKTASNVYIGNPDSSNSVDVRIISHYKA